MRKVDFSVNLSLDESQAQTRLISHSSHPQVWKVRDYSTSRCYEVQKPHPQPPPRKR
ncbi:MAG: hypothetical protein WCO29_04790 [Nostocales cyanobacterium ELA583]|jgi:hypothetical protein